METEKWKFPVVICITVTYTLSFVLMNIGYFTPEWVTGLEGIFPWWEIKCTSAGLVSGWCRFDLTDLGTDAGNYGRIFFTYLSYFRSFTDPLFKLYFSCFNCISTIKINNIHSDDNR